jgi:subtilisin family serine protease
VAKNHSVQVFSVDPVDFDWVVEQMQADPAVRVEREIVPDSLTLQQAPPSTLTKVVVATMPSQVAAELEKHPQIVLEEDHLLLPQPGGTAANLGADPGLVSPFGTSSTWQIKLTGPDGTPVTGATVYLYGQGVPAQGRTDQAGLVTLSLTNESDSTLRALYVNPLADYWSMWVNRPALTSGLVNEVALESLSATFAGFPQTQILGWGQVAMRLGQVPARMDGAGVTVAVVDSGAAALTHPDLLAVHDGVDLTTQPSNPVQWTDDVIAHGSHCTGVIAGANQTQGIRGFAPGAKVHEARIFPGGRVSSLLDALDYCITQQIDVVNMSLGTGGTSQIMLEKLAQARQQGVACIVAAGNSGDAVQFPGSSPDVLTVAAVGKDGTFPDNSYHAQQRWVQGKADNGYFSAQFSCHGPEVDVCGPGVAVVSSVPAAGYAAWDGTSMATPHVTGLAALVLAHHPDFQQPGLRLRNAARVDRLFEILKQSATPLDVGDPTRVGSGLPDALRALNLTGGSQAGADDQAATRSVLDELNRILSNLRAAGLIATPAAATGLLPQTVGITGTDMRSQLAQVRAQLQNAGLDLPEAA